MVRIHTAPSPAELPKVGDWVAISTLPGEGKAVIHHVLPRQSRLSRKASGRETEEQVMVANVAVCFIVQSLDRFNPALLQRHLAMAREGGVQPVIVLNKLDLCDDLEAKLAAARKAAEDTRILPVCALTGAGTESLSEFIQAGAAVVFIGPSGVGKSTLINFLYGEEVQVTAEVRETDAKGRHTTTWRELILLPNGGLVIDTPGMREFHMWMSGENLQEAYPDIEELAVKCHFRSCSHTVEKKCAVQDALAAGQLPRERYDNYMKLRRETEFLESAQRKRGAQERKRKTKASQRAFDRLWRGGED